MVEGNIKLRFLSETHELACHPHYLTVLIKSCTHPREGSTKERIIRQAHNILHDELGAAVSERAIENLICLAIELELLEKRALHWAAKGYVVDNISSRIEVIRERVKRISSDLWKNKKPFTHAILPLEQKERIVYLKYLLDADGAFLINLLKELFPESSRDQEWKRDFLEEGYIERVFIKVAEDYLANVFEIKPRFELRQLLKRAKQGYEGHVRLHKFVPRMEALSDIGIVEKVSINKEIRYQPRLLENHSMVKAFLKEFDNPLDLDRIFSIEGDFYSRVARLFGFSSNTVDLNRDHSLLVREIIKSYESVRDETFRLAHLDAIRDIVCINFLCDHAKLCEWKHVNRTIETLHKESEKDVRYHVNDWGVISYFAMTPDYVKKHGKI